MRGFPKHIATRQDIDNLMPLYPEQTKAHLQRLLEGRYTWQQKAVLADKDAGITDATHEVVVQEKTGGGVEKVQMEKIEDQNAKLFRLGLTVKEAETLATVKAAAAVTLEAK